MSETARRTGLPAVTQDALDIGAARGEVVWVDSFDEFAALEREWDELVRSEPSPFLSHGWMRCWWDSFGDGRAMRVCTVRRDGRLTAALPLWSRRGLLEGWSNDETDEFRPIAASDADLQTVVAAVAGARWSRLTLRGLPESHRSTHLMLEAARGAGPLLLDTREDSPVIETTGSVEDYRKSMSRNTRQRVGKHRRKLEREHDVRIEVLRDPPDPLDRVEEALALEAAGWKGRAGSAVLSSERRTAFYRGLTEAFAGAGLFRVSELRVNGRLAAFDLAILRNRRVYSLITSYDESVGNYSPGLVLRMAIVEACFEQGFAANDLLGMLLDWKSKFATRTRPTRTLRVYRRRPASLVHYAGRNTILPLARRQYNRINELRRRRARYGPVQPPA
jgi:CelD/BcsL family acetyltransferase involved in cellulose biosynthesis